MSPVVPFAYLAVTVSCVVWLGWVSVVKVAETVTEDGMGVAGPRLIAGTSTDPFAGMVKNADSPRGCDPVCNTGSPCPHRAEVGGDVGEHPGTVGFDLDGSVKNADDAGVV